jgi:tRNA A-37 threonylcarbamoyl transferase component Bud32
MFKNTTNSTKRSADKNSLITNVRNILNTKFSLIETQFCEKWSSELQQKFAKKELTLEFDWNSLTNDLILTQYLDVTKITVPNHMLVGYSYNRNTSLERIIEEKFRESGDFQMVEQLLTELITEVSILGILETMLNEVDSYVTYKKYLHEHLKQIIFRYSSKVEENGYLSQDGTQMVHYIDVVNRSGTKLTWMNRPCQLEHICDTHIDYLYFSLNNYILPEYTNCIRGVMRKNITLEMAWDTISETEKLDCYRNLHNIQSALVLQRISRAFDDISAYEPEEIVDTIVQNISKITLRHTQRKHHMYDKTTKTIKLHLVMNDESNGFYDIDDYYSIIRYSGLFSLNRFPVELTSSASQLPCLANNISIPIKELIQRNLIWMPNLEEKKAFDTCQRFIDQKFNIEQQSPDIATNHRKSRTFSFMPSTTGRRSIFGSNQDSAESLKPRRASVQKATPEQPIHAWHVVKYNNNNMAQERILFLTTHAYYVFRYDFPHAKLDEGHFKRHDLTDIDVIDIADSIVKIFTREKVNRSLFSKITGTEDQGLIEREPATDCNTIFTSDYLENHPRLRIHKEPPTRQRPDTKGLYSNIFTFFEPSKAHQMVREIAWMVYGVSVLRKGAKAMKPFQQTIPVRQSKGVNVGALLYNRLGFGLTSDRNEQWCEFVNPLYNKLDMNEDHGDIKMGTVRLTGGSTEQISSPTTTAEDEEDYSDASEIEFDPSMDEEERNQKIMEKYQVEQQIGSGNEGAIYLATNHRQKKVAIKAVGYGETEMEKVDYEVTLVKDLKHENIIRYHETFVLTSETLIGSEKRMYMVMEYCDTTLEKVISLLSQKGDALANNLLTNWVHQVVKGIAHMHSRGILHRDIKTENILVRTHHPTTREEKTPSKWLMKICDFGFSTKLEKKKRRESTADVLSDDDTTAEDNTLYGTPLYMAPEIATFKPYDDKADVWSFGVVLIQLLLQKTARDMPNIFEQMSRQPDYVKKLVKENVSIYLFQISIVFTLCYY